MVLNAKELIIHPRPTRPSHFGARSSAGDRAITHSIPLLFFLVRFESHMSDYVQCYISTLIYLEYGHGTGIMIPRPFPRTSSRTWFFRAFHCPQR